ncbi:phage tail assembly chaperone [Sphingopyxis sp. PAMC25046]|uniref:phage tail assembly chaperone n=1 Tax=Sphingopyxis sp. PAMC25046 TaxID=2565556 RepID=UPI00109E0B6B|nr:phage tail assembly chaperone [Sphingopyxis sp. PAMC25046]QCB56078.1 phage tail assembly chaperone [Sphingopyxis sp. PAMC25046]
MADDRLGPAAIRLAGVMARVAGWRPGEFWAATPADVRAALAGWVDPGEATCFDGAALTAMMERFPDG